MLHDRRQRHRKRPRKLADRQLLLFVQPRQEGPSGRIGERSESAVQSVACILYHVVKCMIGPRRCQARCPDAARLYTSAIATRRMHVVTSFEYVLDLA